MSSQQLNIFTGAGDSRVRYARGSETSRAAAEAQVPRLGRLQRLYLDALRAHRGLTDHEAAGILRRPLSSINGRRNELAELGMVRDSGRTRLSPYGKAATVWEINPTGGN